jgi:hypothetical protein
MSSRSDSNNTEDASDKSLTQWFKEDWVDISRPKPGGGFEPCGRSDADTGKYPKCVPAARAAKMTQAEIDSAVRRKRRAESQRDPGDRSPINVPTVKSDPVNVPTDPELYARIKAEAKAKFDVYPSIYANAWLVREYKKRGGTYRTIGSGEGQSKKMANVKPTREMALRIARIVGCRGVHEVDGKWMPCSSPEALREISMRAETDKKQPQKKDAKDDCGCGGPCCDEQKSVQRKRRGVRHKKRWEDLAERGIIGISTAPDGSLSSEPIGMKELSGRQQAIYDDLEDTVEEHGKFGRGVDADGSHYVVAAKNPFIGEGIVCSNCAFWVGPKGCQIVQGEIQPNAICKFWVIDEEKLPS